MGNQEDFPKAREINGPLLFLTFPFNRVFSQIFSPGATTFGSRNTLRKDHNQKGCAPEIHYYPFGGRGPFSNFWDTYLEHEKFWNGGAIWTLHRKGFGRGNFISRLIHNSGFWDRGYKYPGGERRSPRDVFHDL